MHPVLFFQWPFQMKMKKMKEKKRQIQVCGAFLSIPVLVELVSKQDLVFVPYN